MALIRTVRWAMLKIYAWSNRYERLTHAQLQATFSCSRSTSLYLVQGGLHDLALGWTAYPRTFKMGYVSFHGYGNSDPSEMYSMYY